MNEVRVEIEVVEIPKNWKTAQEMHAVASDLRNSKFAELMDNIMAKIQIASEAGALSSKIRIGGGRHIEVYERAQKTLRALGYTVSGETCGASWDRDWSISW